MNETRLFTSSEAEARLFHLCLHYISSIVVYFYVRLLDFPLTIKMIFENSANSRKPMTAVMKQSDVKWRKEMMSKSDWNCDELFPIIWPTIILVGHANKYQAVGHQLCGCFWRK